MTAVLVAGATGALGREVVAALTDHGDDVHALVRDPARLPDGQRAELVVADAREPGEALNRACRDMDVVFSAMGATTSTNRVTERTSFEDVDRRGNLNLLAAASAAGVQKFVYVSVFNAQRLGHLNYVRAHEDVVRALQDSGLDFTVVRANGFFSGYLELLDLARKGRVVLFGDGEARSNPIHERDLAQVCVQAIHGREQHVDVGGPQVLKRREEAELAFAALGRPPKISRLPRPVSRVAFGLIGRVDRRRAQILKFLAEIHQIDMVAPSNGTRRLGDFFREHAAA